MNVEGTNPFEIQKKTPQFLDSINHEEDASLTQTIPGEATRSQKLPLPRSGASLKSLAFTNLQLEGCTPKKALKQTGIPFHKKAKPFN